MRRVLSSILSWFVFIVWHWLAFVTGAGLGWITYMVVGTSQLDHYFALEFFGVATMVWVYMISYETLFEDRRSFFLTTSKMLVGYTVVAGALMRSGLVGFYAFTLFASFIVSVLIVKLLDFVLSRNRS